MQKTLSEIRTRCLFRLKKKSDDRLDEELKWFETNGGAQAILLMSNFVRHLKSQRIHVGAGARKECSSLVCWGLGITNINPCEWNLPFDSFVKEFEQEATLQICTSSGGAFEMSILPSLTGDAAIIDAPEYGTVKIHLLDDNRCPECLFVVHEETELDLLKTFQDNCSKKIYDIRLDGTLLADIKENGLAGFSAIAGADKLPLIEKLHPECFSDLCLLFVSSRLREEFRRITEIHKTGDAPSTGNTEADRILKETYGVPVYREQLAALEKLGVILSGMEPHKETFLYPSKATAVTVTTEAVIATAFRRRMSRLYENTHQPLTLMLNKEKNELIRQFRKKSQSR